ncbi:esterase-like activity of phytase family protein [Cellulophaga baltica]|uniref:esterase-like activity of phytase family protein n=1 Tax=Cellulophaga TaxID=104264 RepID=UPI001C075DC8|nr:MULTISPECIES: esterase-like activity of phytase family protein [Cellulophaga]MBU2997148.1 esterase-like activity of phytase family protein [Cellulophaga baltica]MDO6768546.1 esterase-like activity of phytase family protein [Cellulophaga sp. 1_MG-2023]
MLKYFFIVVISLGVFSCDSSSKTEKDVVDDLVTELPIDEEVISEAKTLSLKFIGEQIIPDGEMFNGELVGGLSGIDYKNGAYYLICDSHVSPIRYYKAELIFDANSFSSVEITAQIELLDKEGNSFEANMADPESIIYDVATNSIVWSSEGYANDGLNPFVRTANIDGTFLNEFEIPSIFQADATASAGPRANGVFEGLSLSYDDTGYWVATELPLIQDGEEPVFENETDSPVRFLYIDKATGTFQTQIAYELDKVARKVDSDSGVFTVNGVTDILQYEEHKFLVMERSFTTGTTDGGITLKIYDVDSSNATDVSEIAALSDASYTAVEKTLVLDFEYIRSQLSTISGGDDHIVDNIEGITFGPDLENGNKSIVVVSDNNFSSITPQLNQFIAFELIQE